MPAPAFMSRIGASSVYPMTLPFPVQGIDLSVPVAQLTAGRPVLRTVAAHNVRNRPRPQYRNGGGKRAGLLKATDTAAGVGDGRRVTAIGSVPEASETVQWSPVASTFRGLTVGDNTRAPYLGVNLALFAQDGTTGNVENSYDAQINKTDLSGTLNSTFWPNPGPREYGGLVFDWYPAGSGNLKYPGLAVMGITDNDVSAEFFAAGTASTGTDGEGTIGEPQGIGPFVRGSGDLSQCFCACLLRSGANQVQLVIRKIDGATRTTVATSAAFSLDGVAWTDTSPYSPQTDNGAGITGTLVGAYPLLIRLVATATTITATLYWPRQGPGNSTTPAVTLTYASTDYASNTRGGVIVGFSPTGGTTVLNRWYLGRIRTQIRVQPPRTVAARLLRTDTTSPTPQRYYMPPEFTAVRVTTAGTVTTFTGTSQASAPSAPAIDTLPVAIVGNPAANASHFIVPTTAPAKRYAVEVNGRPLGLTGYDSDTTEDVLGAAFRVSADFKNGILIEVRHGFKFTSLAYQRTRQDALETIRFVALVNGARTVLETYTTANLSMPVFKSDVWMRWTDLGVVGSGGRFTLSINGAVTHTFDVTTMSGWNAGTMAGLLTATNLVGACAYGDTAAPEFTYAAGFRLIDTDDEEDELALVGRVRCSLALVTNSGYVDLAVLGKPGLSRCSGDLASINPLPSITYAGGKWYLVDGSIQKVIDPVARTVTDLVASAGTAPTAMRLACTYRGALLLASSQESPSFWALARRGVSDPTDFDYGADPTPTSAVAGSDPDVGEPPDPIVALIPFGNEAVLFGTTRNFYILERDPGYGGRLVTFTEATGIIGPRAWCRGAAADDGTNGELFYFVGNGDLWRMVAGGRPVNLTRGRMPELDCDGATTIVQLAYDETDHIVHVFLTPADGAEAGVHVVYDVDENAPFTDGYPLEHGPWAVARGYGTSPEDRRPLLGGNDGYLRRFSHEATDDDGSAIDAYVDILVPDLGAQFAETMVEEMSASFLDAVTPMNWYWFANETPEKCGLSIVGEEVASGTWLPNRLPSRATPAVSIRRTGNAHKVRIRQNSAATFALESLTVVMNMQGRRRIV